MMRPWIGNRGLLAGAMLLATVGVSTARGDIFNGVDWGDNVYDPGTTAGKNGLPTTASWTVSAGAGSSALVTGDVLHFETATDENPGMASTYSFKTVNGLGSDTLTVELKVAAVKQRGVSWVSSLLMGYSAAGQTTVYAEMFFGSAHTLLNGASGWYTADLTGLHTYRITVQPINDTQQRYNVYLDGQETPIQTAVRNKIFFTFLQMGDASTGTATNGVTEVDYIRWTTAGAFAPEIPEPATLGLLALGAVAMFRRGR